MMSPDPTDETLRALIEGALGEAERVELEKLLERNPDRLRRFETITGYDDFRQLFLRSAPRRRGR